MLCQTGNYAWSCFASQQSAEKALKAILESLAAPSIGYNLLSLASVVSEKIKVSDSIRSACNLSIKLSINFEEPAGDEFLLI
ncbi:MAG: HEPN domain-containing protein [Candidatus Bathyarchaeia archaeon]